ncbi:unnamed protein product [Brassica rapa]|uniref:Uncharacterized protein n=1 Tax=Brassica campestris TaxID=3711 RepID=A0A8D9FZY4_BRACM|nr:unnamed protein product [Brassica rapa]
MATNHEDQNPTTLHLGCALLVERESQDKSWIEGENQSREQEDDAKVYTTPCLTEPETLYMLLESFKPTLPGEAKPTHALTEEIVKVRSVRGQRLLLHRDAEAEDR